MLWRDGLHLTNEGTNMLSNNFLQYLKNVPLGNDIGFLQIDKQIRAEQKVVIKVLRSFPVVPKLSNNTNSKLELSCITNIKKIRSENIGNVIIGTLNINSLSSKFDDLKVLTSGIFDILIITETKLDETYPISQFHINGYSMPYRLDRNRNGGGVIIYVREDVPSKILRKHFLPNDIEGIFVEINFRKSKWLLCGTYHPPSQSDQYYFDNIDEALDVYCQYEKIMLAGDFKVFTKVTVFLLVCQTAIN